MKISVDGYAWLPLAELGATQVEWLRKQLTLVQAVSKEYRSRTECAIVECFVEDKEGGRLGVAREFFFEKATRDYDFEWKVREGAPWPSRLVAASSDSWKSYQSEDESQLTFFDTEKNRPVELRGEQLQAFEMTTKHLRRRPAAGGIVQAPTGWGKTVFALSLLQEMKVRTAVLVHRKFLMNQWKKRITRFLPDAKIGCISGKTWEVNDCHVVLVMIETIASWVKRGKVPAELANLFGMVITDEVHRAAAPTWSSVMPQFHAAKRVGISARPKRSDRLENAFFYHIGPKIFTGQELQLIPKIRRVWTTFTVNHPRLNPQFMSLEMMLQHMVKSVTYNQDVVDQILAALKTGRKILVYSGIVDHLRRLKIEVDNQWKGDPIKTDFFIGGMLEGELDEAETANVIFATYAMAKDALDIPALDTVVLATPIRNPEQPAGRCLRPMDGKKDPIVVDMRADNVPVCKDYAQSRDRIYEKLYLKPQTAVAG